MAESLTETEVHCSTVNTNKTKPSNEYQNQANKTAHDLDSICVNVNVNQQRNLKSFSRLMCFEWEYPQLVPVPPVPHILVFGCLSACQVDRICIFYSVFTRRKGKWKGRERKNQLEKCRKELVGGSEESGRETKQRERGRENHSTTMDESIE